MSAHIKAARHSLSLRVQLAVNGHRLHGKENKNSCSLEVQILPLQDDLSLPWPFFFDLSFLQVMHCVYTVPLRMQSINEAFVWRMWIKQGTGVQKNPWRLIFIWAVRWCPHHQSSCSKSREGRQNDTGLLNAKCQARTKREAPRWLGLLKAFLSRATARWLISLDVSFYPVSH